MGAACKGRGHGVQRSNYIDSWEVYMGIGVSLILIAVGAILTWAVTAEASGVDLTTVGVILMVVGLAGGLISLMFWSSWGGLGGFRRETVVRDSGDRVIEER
jgi:hypothetical protein